MQEELDAMRQEYAEFVAKIVMSDFSLWERYSDYSWLAVDVLLRFASDKQQDDLNSESIDDEIYLEKFLRKEIKIYIDDPDSYQLQFQQRLSG